VTFFVCDEVVVVCVGRVMGDRCVMLLFLIDLHEEKDVVLVGVFEFLGEGEIY